jgi:hypothetical protein
MDKRATAMQLENFRALITIWYDEWEGQHATLTQWEVTEQYDFEEGKGWILMVPEADEPYFFSPSVSYTLNVSVCFPGASMDTLWDMAREGDDDEDSEFVGKDFLADFATPNRMCSFKKLLAT